jgi:NAD(P)-dependent dehydrogenase (short-subunit alcohol dehydrogenase family)
MSADLAGKRVLILGAETEIGRAVTAAVAEAGASVAAVAATSDAEAAFAVQRLARRLSSDERKVIAQAIDATNEAAVRVMVRQVSKELGGLNGVVYCERPMQPFDPSAVGDTEDHEEILRRMEEHLRRHSEVAHPIVGHVLEFGGRELDRAGGGPLVLVNGIAAMMIAADSPRPKWWLEQVSHEGKQTDEVVKNVIRAVRSRGLWWKVAERTPRPLLPIYRFLARIFRPGES